MFEISNSDVVMSDDNNQHWHTDTPDNVNSSNSNSNCFNAENITFCSAPASSNRGCLIDDYADI